MAADLLTVVLNGIPLRFALFVARQLGNLAYYVDRRHRAYALRNLELAYGDTMSLKRRRRTARLAFQSFAMTLVEGVVMPRKIATGALKRQLRFSGNIDAFLAQARSGQPMMMLSAHLGSWEYLVASLGILDIPTIAVMRPLNNRALNQWVIDLRLQAKQQLTDKKGALRHMRRALAEGRSIGLLVDQHDRHGPTMTFLGRQTPTQAAPAIMAHRYGLPIFVGYVERVRPGQEYHLRVVGPLRMPPQSSQEAAMAETTQRYTRILEGFIRQRPEQWFWLHRRFKYDAGGSPYDTPPQST